MKKHLPLLFAVAIPILALIGLMVQREIRQNSGGEIIVSIDGYDPRDLLSGHYLIYRLDLGSNVCEKDGAVEVCLNLDDDGRVVSAWSDASSQSAECKQILTGVCENNRFEAGVERYYIPESDAKRLDKIVREGDRAELKLAVDGNGIAAIEELLIDGESVDR